LSGQLGLKEQRNPVWKCFRFDGDECGDGGGGIGVGAWKNFAQIYFRLGRSEVGGEKNEERSCGDEAAAAVAEGGIFG
jgi:hypothetical protein